MISRSVLVLARTGGSLRWSSMPKVAFTTAAVPRSTLLSPLEGQGRPIRTTARHLSTSGDDDLPYHLVVGLPALSPTMASGALAEWYVNEGDKFTAGDAVAKIETDKATIDFEAQDDGFVARLLMEAGTGLDVAVGTPIMITVEEEDNVAAFKNYTPPAAAAAAAAVEASPPAAPAAPAKVETAPPPPPPVATPPTPSPVTAPPVPTPPPPPVMAAAAAPPPPSSAPATTAGTNPAVAWGSLIQTSSPLVASLAKKQRKYVDLYGTTGQTPVL